MTGVIVAVLDPVWPKTRSSGELSLSIEKFVGVTFYF
jgi:hypothetical protein